MKSNKVKVDCGSRQSGGNTKFVTGRRPEVRSKVTKFVTGRRPEVRSNNSKSEGIAGSSRAQYRNNHQKRYHQKSPGPEAMS